MLLPEKSNDENDRNHPRTSGRRGDPFHAAQSAIMYYFKARADKNQVEEPKERIE